MNAGYKAAFLNAGFKNGFIILNICFEKFTCNENNVPALLIVNKKS